MKAARVEAWLAKHWDRLVYEYGLDQWDIDYEIDEDPEAEDFGCCDINAPYSLARVTFYTAKIDTIKNLEETCRHELEHCLDAPFHIYASTVGKLVDGPMEAVLQELFFSCMEMSRANIGRFRARMRG